MVNSCVNLPLIPVIFRPAYMDEYERLEEELQKLYEKYMQNFRNQSYLEQLRDEHNQTEMDKTEVKLWHLSMFICMKKMKSQFKSVSEI